MVAYRARAAGAIARRLSPDDALRSRRIAWRASTLAGEPAVGSNAPQAETAAKDSE